LITNLGFSWTSRLNLGPPPPRARAAAAATRLLVAPRWRRGAILKFPRLKVENFKATKGAAIVPRWEGDHPPGPPPRVIPGRDLVPRHCGRAVLPEVYLYVFRRKEEDSGTPTGRRGSADLLIFVRIC
jgi:hypothetical protein